MVVRVGINGYGRVGRSFHRALLATDAEIEVVAINDLGDLPTLAHLLRYDTISGRLGVEVEVADGRLVVDGRSVSVHSEPGPERVPWHESEVDVVLEATGRFTDADAARAHVTAGGATKVVISAPSSDADLTVVMGVNHRSYDPTAHTVVSNASCTTNCLAPMAKVLHEGLGIERGLMTTVHAYTSDQRLLDNAHRDLRRARAAAVNVVPTSTGAARALGLVLPELEGRLDGFALRVPVPTGSVTDLTVDVRRSTTVEEVNALFEAAATAGDLAPYLTYSTDPIVSSDIVTQPWSCIFDAPLTKVIDHQVKVVGWYDNEWGYSHRLVDLVRHLGESL